MGHFDIPKELVRQLQKKELDMLLYVDQFCTEHDLTYFLCGGCCIGTVRNGGFIPWDDDVDVFMPRTDYERIKKLWKNNGKYSIQYPQKDVRTATQALVICDEETTFIRTCQKDLDIKHGIFLDVLPLDGCPTGWRRKMQKLWALLYGLYVVENAPVNHGRFLQLLGKIGLILVPVHSLRYRLWRFCEKKMSQYPIEQCDFITELCAGTHYMQNEYPKHCFDHAVRMSFEGHMMNMPVDYDTYLRIAFGNYMELPPKEKQVSHHAWEVIDLEHSYREYQEKKYFTKNAKNCN